MSLIIDEQRNLRSGDDDQSDTGDTGDHGGGPQDPSGQASHRGHIPRARVKVSDTQEKLTSNISFTILSILQHYILVMQVLNLSLAYAIAFLASNVPYVIHELILALDKQDNMGPIMAALFGDLL